jgi:hypothetical protein
MIIIRECLEPFLKLYFVCFLYFLFLTFQFLSLPHRNMSWDPVNASLGGLFVGLASGVYMYSAHRVAGNSGALKAIVLGPREPTKLAFAAGLVYVPLASLASRLSCLSCLACFSCLSCLTRVTPL